MEERRWKKIWEQMKFPQQVRDYPGLWIIGLLLGLNLLLTASLWWHDGYEKHHSAYGSLGHHLGYQPQGYHKEWYLVCLSGDCQDYHHRGGMDEGERYHLHRDMMRREQAFDRYLREQERLMDEFWGRTW